MGSIDWRDAEPASAVDFGLTRRDQLKAGIASFVSFALLGEARAMVPGRRVSARAWIDRQEEIAEALSQGQISGKAWMSEVERLAREVDLAELLDTVRRSRVTEGGTPNHNDPHKRYVRFLDEAGQPRQLTYGAAFFDFAPTNVVTPHGHKHMVSAHMVVKGAFRVRNFDRLRDEGEAMIIRPTRDYIARVGHLSAMSTERDNIHWFVPHGGVAATFDVVIDGLDAGAPEYDIKAIDPVGGRHLADGAIVAPIISFADSSARYTADV